MSDGLNPEQQLSEIHEMMAEARSGYTGGGVIALVWGVLTAAAVAVDGLNLVRNSWLVWGAHNLLGWGFTMAWFVADSRREGRVSLRGKSVLRLWAAVSLAVWLCIGALCGGVVGLSTLLPMFLGMGVFATGLIYQSTFSQCVGIALLVAGPAIAAFAPRPLVDALAMAAIVIAGIIWGVGSWLVKERR